MNIPTLRRARGQVYEPSYETNPALTPEEIRQRTKAVLVEAFNVPLPRIFEPLDVEQMKGHQIWKNELLESPDLNYLHEVGHDFGLIGMLIACRASTRELFVYDKTTFLNFVE